MYWIKPYMFPLCLCLVFSLMSCQEEEIIPIDEEDLIENLDEIGSSFDISQAQDFIYDEKGVKIGYLDEKLDQYNLDGSAVNFRSDNRNPLRAVFYKDSHFRGKRHAVFSPSRDISTDVIAELDLNISSLVVPPGCKVTIKEKIHSTANPRNGNFFIKEYRGFNINAGDDDCDVIYPTNAFNYLTDVWRLYRYENGYTIGSYLASKFININSNGTLFLGNRQASSQQWNFIKKGQFYYLRSNDNNEYVQTVFDGIEYCSNGFKTYYSTNSVYFNDSKERRFQLIPTSLGDKKKTYTAPNDKPLYVDIIRDGMDNKTRSYTISCKNDENTFAGFAHNNTNYAGYALPLFTGTNLNLSSPTFSPWNNNIASISTNRHSIADGFMLYDHHNDLNKDHYWIDPDRDYAALNNLSNNNQRTTSNAINIKDNATHIIHSPKMAHGFEKANFPIGAVLYTGENFTGRPYIFPKGFKITSRWYNAVPGWGWPNFKSAIIAPNTSVSDDVSTTLKGYHTKLNGKLSDYDYIKISGSPSSSNDFCGVIHDKKYVDLDDIPAVVGYDLPIFNGLSNKTIDSEKVLTLNNIPGINDVHSSFVTYPFDTRCKGATFWEQGHSGFLNKKRIWFPVDSSDPKSFPFPSGIDNKTSNITTEGCTEESVGVTGEEFQELVDMLNNYAEVANGLGVGRWNCNLPNAGSFCINGIFKYRPNLVASLGVVTSLASIYVNSPSVGSMLGIGASVGCAVNLIASIQTIGNGDKAIIRTYLPHYMVPSLGGLVANYNQLKASLDFSLGGVWTDANGATFSIESWATSNNWDQSVIDQIVGLQPIILRETLNKMAFYLSAYGTIGVVGYRNNPYVEGAQAAQDIRNSTLRGGN